MFRESDELFENLPFDPNLEVDPHAFDDDSVDKFHRHRAEVCVHLLTRLEPQFFFIFCMRFFMLSVGFYCVEN